MIWEQVENEDIHNDRESLDNMVRILDIISMNVIEFNVWTKIWQLIEKRNK